MAGRAVRAGRRHAAAPVEASASSEPTPPTPLRSGYILEAAPSLAARDFGAAVRGAVASAAPTSGPRCSPTRMMPIGVPRVPYRMPKEGVWQWIDIWNCMAREGSAWGESKEQTKRAERAACAWPPPTTLHPTHNPPVPGPHRLPAKARGRRAGQPAGGHAAVP